MFTCKWLSIVSLVLFSGFCFSQKETAVNWQSFESAITSSQQQPKKIFVDIYTDWCGWCKRLDKDTFSDSAVAKILNKYYYPAKLDAERKDTVTVLGKTYKFVPSGKRGFHELAASLLNGKMSYPTTVVLDEKFQIIGVIPGYRGPGDYAKLLTYYGTNLYQNMTLEEYKISLFEKNKRKDRDQKR